MSSAVPVLKRTLQWGGVLALAIAIVGSVIGYLVAGAPGLVGALFGAAMALVFLGVTAVSIIVAAKFDIGGFFAIVMGAWLLKFVVFIVLILVLGDQPWIDSKVLFLTLVIAVIGTLVVDVVVVTRSRMPYVSDVELPGSPSDDEQGR